MVFKLIARLIVFPLLLLAPPLFGAVFQGAPLMAFIKFPPSPAAIAASGFSWPVFLGVAGITFVALFPFARRLADDDIHARTRASSRRALPWWGMLGMGVMVVAWVFAWTRFSWFEPLQDHTFTPLWLGYILLVNALCYRRTGRCLLLDAPVFFVALFPLSAYFWWLFEYLNQFGGNWYYVDSPVITPLEQFIVGSVSFSTVLPAVLSTTQWLASFHRLQRAFTGLNPLRVTPMRALLTGGLFLSLLGLVMLGTHPRYAFPALWISPLFILSSMSSGESDVLSRLSRGDWRPIGLPALAALICGLLWEMWNYRSRAHWEYAVPFVQRFHLFHMPLAGYAAYLPFGAVCYLFMRLFDDKARLSCVLQPMHSGV